MSNLALKKDPAEAVILNYHKDISKLAVEALLTEAFLTPKPGLVDTNNSGSHSDMTLDHFVKSAYSLKEYFEEIALVGANMPISKKLREMTIQIGKEGEKTMLNATGGINTHKGAIWALGLISTATANLVTKDIKLSINNILDNVSSLVSFDDKVINQEQSSHGQQVKVKYQHIKNAHDSALDGFPILKEVAYPSFLKFSAEKKDIRLINVLVEIMSHLEDTCIIYRSNIDVLKQIQKLSNDVIINGGVGTKKGMTLFTNLETYVNKHSVSPGGSADMLAATIFIDNLINHFN